MFYCKPGTPHHLPHFSSRQGLIRPFQFLSFYAATGNTLRDGVWTCDSELVLETLQIILLQSLLLFFKHTLHISVSLVIVKAHHAHFTSFYIMYFLFSSAIRIWSAICSLRSCKSSGDVAWPFFAHERLFLGIIAVCFHTINYWLTIMSNMSMFTKWAS